jgi:hypothetical protein
MVRKRHLYRSIFIAGGKWRGVMPFRLSDEYRNLLKQHKRTGEPFPVYQAVGEIRDQAHGKAHRSFTEKMRNALYDWVEANTGFRHGQISFDYRLYRHKIIHVIGDWPLLRHDPLHGKGYAGFILEVRVGSIDGLPYKGLDRRSVSFAWNRIIGREKLLLLPEGDSHGNRP